MKTSGATDRSPDFASDPITFDVLFTQAPILGGTGRKIRAYCTETCPATRPPNSHTVLVLSLPHLNGRPPSDGGIYMPRAPRVNPPPSGLVRPGRTGVRAVKRRATPGDQVRR